MPKQKQFFKQAISIMPTSNCVQPIFSFRYISLRKEIVETESQNYPYSSDISETSSSFGASRI